MIAPALKNQSPIRHCSSGLCLYPSFYLAPTDGMKYIMKEAV